AGLRAPRPTGRGTGRSRPPAGPRPAEAAAPGPRALPAPGALLPRPAARHRPDAAADLAEQVARAPEYPGQAGATITRAPRRRHHPLAARLSRYGHDISAAYRATLVRSSYNSTGRPGFGGRRGGPSRPGRCVASTRRPARERAQTHPRSRGG